MLKGVEMVPAVRARRPGAPGAHLTRRGVQQTGNRGVACVGGMGRSALCLLTHWAASVAHSNAPHAPPPEATLARLSLGLWGPGGLGL